MDDMLIKNIINKLLSTTTMPVDFLNSNGSIVISTMINRNNTSYSKETTKQLNEYILNNNIQFKSFILDDRVFAMINEKYLFSIPANLEMSNEYVRFLSQTAYDLLHNSLITNKQEFIKYIILNDVSDVSELLKKTHIKNEVDRIVFVIKLEDEDNNLNNAEKIADVLNKVFSVDSDDFIFYDTNNNIILVKSIINDDELSDDEIKKDLYELSEAIGETIFSEMSIKLIIGIGNRQKEIIGLRESYKQAKHATDIGAFFKPLYTIIDNAYRIYYFEDIFLEKLLYDIPHETREKYSSILYQQDEKGVLNTEMMKTLSVFFENNLNISLASRELYIHRNTLLYRIEKIQKTFSLDLRKFRDAATFLIMMMLAGKVWPDTE